MRPIDAAALNILQEPHDTHMYISQLMNSSKTEQDEKNVWFSTPPIQRRILQEISELAKKKN